jgi:uncharacterized protein YbcV (DUF1398 family)
MFTLDQIKEAHAKVKSGADFPQYVQDLIQLEVIHYSTFTDDGHTIYFGKENHRAQSPAKYPALKIAGRSNKEQFAKDLKTHQAGKTDYPTFCNDAAMAGVEKWTVDLAKMTCTYYDKKGNAMLTENIPLPNKA